jgi:glycosyltransferase involved in cell wall biosynthesis
MRVALELELCCGQRSGIGIYTYELAKRLKNDENICFQGNVFNFLNRNDNGESLKDFVFPININTFMSYGVYRRIWHILPLTYRMMFKQADVTHFFNYIVPPRVEGKIINSIFDMGYLFFPETLDPKNLKRIKDDIDYSIERSDKIITISEFIKNSMVDILRIQADKIEVVYAAPSTAAPAEDHWGLQDKFKITGPYLLYVGNLEPRKNIERLIQAYALLKKEAGIVHKLVIAGKRAWLYDGIFAVAESEGLNEDIIFTGFVSEAEKCWLYDGADLFVYPSLYEGFGMPILEAMRMGTPVVCSNTSSMPEVGGDAAHFINPLEVTSISEGIYKMLTDKERREEKIAAGKLQAAKFTWEASAKKLIEIYRSMQ